MIIIVNNILNKILDIYILHHCYITVYGPDVSVLKQSNLFDNHIQYNQQHNHTGISQGWVRNSYRHAGRVGCHTLIYLSHNRLLQHKNSIDDFHAKLLNN